MHNLFKNRKSVRSFEPKFQITDSQVKEILTAGMVAPSGMNLKEYEFVVVKDKDTLKKLSGLGQYQAFLADCSAAIIVVSTEGRFWIEDCSLAVGYMMLEAVNQGLSSCWANVRKDDGDREALVRKILNIPDDRRVLCALAIGKAAASPSPHTEDEYNKSKVHEEKW
ncbi:nitroreductase family protein [Candidatus Dojkabacteria bacterium]|nr:nitroreductase family protein [Candidatus Dojkabacteria bacterium]